MKKLIYWNFILICLSSLIGCSCFSNNVVTVNDASKSESQQTQSSSSQVNSFEKIKRSNKYRYLYRNSNSDYILGTYQYNGLNISDYYRTYFKTSSFGYDHYYYNYNNPFVKNDIFFHVIYGLPKDCLFTYYDLYENKLIVYKILTYNELSELVSLNNVSFEFEQAFSDQVNFDYKMVVYHNSEFYKNYEIIFDKESYEIKYFGDLIDVDETEIKETNNECIITYDDHDYPVLNFDDKRITLSLSYLEENAEYSEYLLIKPMASIKAKCFNSEVFVQYVPTKTKQEPYSAFMTVFVFDYKTEKLNYLTYLETANIIAVVSYY